MNRFTRWSRVSRPARFLGRASVAGAVVLGAFGLLAAPGAGAATTPGASSPGRSSSAVVGPGRVDLEEPTFSDPTSSTNPLFPVSSVSQAVQLGEEAGVQLRHEITLLDETKIIEVDGLRVETVVSQFVAYGDGRILEVALDYFAQADDGSVWYFGEDVANYEDGVVADHDGTWLAGRDGPPGMIMPADPQVGDVYRPENIPGFVFEEVTVTAVDQSVDGPLGPVPGAIFVEEELMDGTQENKTFAPGYGEFQALVASEGELVTVAVAAPTDAQPGPVPAELATLSSGANAVWRSAPGRWDRASAAVDTMTIAWLTLIGTDPPPLLEDQMTAVLRGLKAAVGARDADAARQAATDVGQASLDLQLQYRPPADIDGARLGLWQRQLVVDRAAGDAAGVASDNAIIGAIRYRIAH